MYNIYSLDPGSLKFMERVSGCESFDSFTLTFGEPDRGSRYLLPYGTRSYGAYNEPCIVYES